MTQSQIQSLHDQSQLLSLHVDLILIALAAVLITDACGLFYLFGWRKRMNGICLRIKHGLIASMCAATVGTGILLILKNPEVMAQKIFWLKMVFVAALCVNGWLIGRKIPLLTSGPFQALTRGSRWTLVLGSMMSFLFWIGTAILGLMI